MQPCDLTLLWCTGSLVFAWILYSYKTVKAIRGSEAQSSRTASHPHLPPTPFPHRYRPTTSNWTIRTGTEGWRMISICTCNVETNKWRLMIQHRNTNLKLQLAQDICCPLSWCCILNVISFPLVWQCSLAHRAYLAPRVNSGVTVMTFFGRPCTAHFCRGWKQFTTEQNYDVKVFTLN